ncbi:MAG: hypothetical protein AUK44_10035 [Porphyromonadaceae bacterium CG2_30_38_12]|nr:MAG: hypothetical protein AUK44_10035 [Porphyromonadaceae bacterium CG2_30_38_12]
MKSKKTNYIFAVLLIAISFTACKSKKALVQPNNVDRKLMEQIDKIRQAEPVFTTANVSKMSVAVEVGGRKFNTSASCKIRADSAIHVSIQPFMGFEMFKVEINKDSLLVYDKINKRLYPVPFAYFKTKFGLTVGFSDLQAILSNRFFTVGTTQPDFLNCKKAESVDNLNVIEYKTTEMLQQILSNSTDRIERQELKAVNSDYQMRVAYSNFIQIDKLVFPQVINIEATNTKQNVKFDFKISKAVFDNELSFTKIDPSKYTVADINQLLNK